MPAQRPNSVSLAIVKRVVVVARRDHRRHRPEDFLARDAHRVVGVDEQRRRHVEAGGRAIEPFAAERQLRAFVLADRDVGLILLELARVDHRPDMRAGLQRVVDDERPHPLGQRVDESLVDRLLDDEARRGRAALAGREIGAVDGAFDRVLEVGIGEHHERVLAAHLELELAHRAGAGGGHALTGPTEPVKVIASTSLWSSIACPTTEPRPITRLNTPFGTPARTMTRPAWAEPGTRSAGLKTTALP